MPKGADCYERWKGLFSETSIASFRFEKCFTCYWKSLATFCTPRFYLRSVPLTTTFLRLCTTFRLFFRCGHNRIRFSAIISKTLHENLTLVWLYRVPSTNVYNLFNTVPIIALQNSNGFLTFASAACTPAGATKDSQRMVENTSKPMPWNVILAPLEWALHDGDKPLANRQSWNNSFSFRILNVQQTNCLSSETWVV